MPSIAYKIAHRRVLVVEEVVDEWQIDYEQAKLACNTDELVRETADLLSPVERVAALIDSGPQFQVDGDGSPTRFLVLVHHVGCLLNKTLDLFNKVNRLAKDVQRLGYTIEGLDSLEKSRLVLNDIRERFYRMWPLPDRKIVKVAKQELKMGKYRVL